MLNGYRSSYETQRIRIFNRLFLDECYGSANEEDRLSTTETFSHLVSDTSSSSFLRLSHGKQNLEFFAEAFSYYYGMGLVRNKLKNKSPRVYEYFEALEYAIYLQDNAER